MLLIGALLLHLAVACRQSFDDVDTLRQTEDVFSLVGGIAVDESSCGVVGPYASERSRRGGQHMDGSTLVVDLDVALGDSYLRIATDQEETILCLSGNTNGHAFLYRGRCLQIGVVE